MCDSEHGGLFCCPLQEPPQEVVAHWPAKGRKWYFVADHKCEEMESKFIMANLGQSMWGGWTDEGVDYFAKVREQVKAGRDQDHVEGMESDFLDRIRMANGLLSSLGNGVSNVKEVSSCCLLSARSVDHRSE